MYCIDSNRSKVYHDGNAISICFKWIKNSSWCSFDRLIFFESFLLKCAMKKVIKRSSLFVNVLNMGIIKYSTWNIQCEKFNKNFLRGSFNYIYCTFLNIQQMSHLYWLLFHFISLWMLPASQHNCMHSPTWSIQRRQEKATVSTDERMTNKDCCRILLLSLDALSHSYKNATHHGLFQNIVSHK